MLMASLDTSIANAALPGLARAFDASFQSVRWVVLVYLLTLTAFTALAGRVAGPLAMCWTASRGSRRS